MITKYSLVRSIKCNYLDAFGVVINVEDYPSFVSWCISTKILHNFNIKQVLNRLTEFKKEYQIENSFVKDISGNFSADLSFGYKMFNYKYISLIKYNIKKDGCEIFIFSNSGPFKSMTNTWLIEGLSLHETKISFDIEFKLKNPLLEVPARASIDYIGTNIVNCFENRINFLPKATKIPN